MLLLAALTLFGCGDDTVDPSNPDAAAAHDASVDVGKAKDGGAREDALLDSAADDPRRAGEAGWETGGD
jgi:hypothetical protein